jgi:glycosyltransferase involved in cell wall biosynthesis
MQLSVFLITYNHEAYIQQTLDSVLCQEVNCPFEIVIGDDASTDKTREICEQYAKKHPNIIRLIAKTPNVGVVPNYIRSLEACQGDYIAYLDGDDYWIDPKKLQKQMDRLQADPNLTICYTSRRVFREDWKGNYLKLDSVYNLEEGIYSITDGEDNKKYKAKDFASGLFFHLSSIMFRKPTNPRIIAQLTQFKNIVDRPLSIILLEELGGYAVKIPDVCMVFRMNNNSAFTPADEIKRSVATNAMYAKLSELYPHLAKYFNHHLNVSAYFALRTAYKEKNKTAVRQLATQILKRPTFSESWQLKFKAALHLVPLVG